MLREHLVKKNAGVESSFRWRGGDISRIEGFSDAVFGFAVTLLVVSLEVPETFNELWEKMHGFVAFTVCFFILFSVWYDQYIFFRRYALNDALTTWLNAALLFVVLFYIYPLKFLFSMLIKLFTGASLQVHLSDGTTQPIIEVDKVPLLMIIYALGFIAVSGIFVVLYARAYRRRNDLELNELETIDTKSSVHSHLLNIGVGILSIAMIGVGGTGSTAWAGMTYWLIGPLQAINGITTAKRKKRIVQDAKTSSQF